MAREQWKNWAGNLHCSCEVVAPRSLEDLREVVKRASGSGRRLRAAGGSPSYSWAPLVPNQDMRYGTPLTTPLLVSVKSRSMTEPGWVSSAAAVGSCPAAVTITVIAAAGSPASV